MRINAQAGNFSYNNPQMNVENPMHAMDGMNESRVDGVPPSMESPAAPTNALSIYGQDPAVEDFPVLKAFQQYIDAEQSKSRKRMIMLSMFFGVLMTILVAVFVFLLGQMNHDKQSANDKLIEFLMRERERSASAPAPVQPNPVQPPVAAANSANDAAIKAMTETLVTLQKQIAEDRAAMQRERDAVRKQEHDAAKASESVRPAAAQPSAAQAELERINREKVEKLKKANALLKAERRKIEAEKAKLREEKIEAYRRKHYPELYAPKANAAGNAMPTSSTVAPKSTAKPVSVPSPSPAAYTPSASAASPAVSTPIESAESQFKRDELKPVEYFSDDKKEYSVDLGDDLDVSVGL